MKKPQWITAGIAICAVIVLFKFGKTIPFKSIEKKMPATSLVNQTISFDSLLAEAKKHIRMEQVIRLNALENSLPSPKQGISNSDKKAQQLIIFHQLAHFWGDSARIFEPYAWYEAEAARLESSEKSLTFAAHLFLENLQVDEIQERRKWKAMQAKDVFERSLLINPGNDSAKVGLGACFIYGNISASPMEGIGKILKVVEKDSSNIYAQLTLVKGSIISGQYDKAVTRLQTVNRLQPESLEPVILLADLYERLGEKEKAVNWYQKSLILIKREDFRSEIELRIETLRKEIKK